jgi:eukaryotic-like serine/threonine-protein kinase
MDPVESVSLLVGRYRLGPIIGRGGMGAVWQARDELLSRDVAAKEIIWPPHLNDDERETARRRAVREAQMAARLNHPNVVGIYDIVEEDDRPWIIMELLPYRSLRDIVRDDGPLTPVQAAQVGLGILAALLAAHAAGILHRDVKPANILVGPPGRVVLTDFGIARATDSPTLTNAGLLVGSPSYMAPERARGEQAVAAGDLWGLGASLYLAVEGRPPFDRNGALPTLTAVVADEPDPPSRAGPLWPVISGLLRKDPAERPGGAEAEEMLQRVAADAEAATANPVPVAPMDADTVVPAAPASTVVPSAIPEPVVPAAIPESAVSPDPAVPGVSGLPAAPELDARQKRSRRIQIGAVLAAAVLGLAAAGTAIGLLLSGQGGHKAALPATSPHPGPRNSPTGRPKTSPSESAPPSPARSTAASPSISATTDPGRGYAALPAGFYRFTNSTGFSIGVPQGWPISHVGHYVYVQDPSNSGIFLIIDQSDQPKADPLADWEQQQANRESSYLDYHLIRLQSVSYPQAEKAADWEFTFDRSGVPVHILNRNILANAKHAYALYWSTPEGDWNADYHYFAGFAATFHPAP